MPRLFQDTHHMVVFSQKGQEIWLGLGVSHVFNKLCQSQDFSGLGAGVAMVVDDAHGLLRLSGVCTRGGRLGRAGGILTSQLVDAPGFKRGREPPARHGDPDGCRSFECTAQRHRSLRDNKGRRRGFRHCMAWSDASLGFSVDGG